MSKIIENFLIPLFVVVSVLYAFNSLGSDGNIQLNKVYHHTTNNIAHLERANIALYFSSDPHVQEISYTKECNGQSCSFFFPGVVINPGECQAMVKRLQEYNDCYTVHVQEVITPTQGIMITFNFDPHKFAISYERFDSIGLQKGIVFRLYNKELLEQLKQAHNKPVLRMLMNSRPRIAIDSGHGGSDCGAKGYNGIQEKDICLAIGTAVGNLLEQHGCSVVLTRNGDCGVGLDERTSYANNHYADLFVSIHANYARSPKAIGVETFCLRPSLLKEEYSQLSTEQSHNIKDIMNKRTSLSTILAQSVQCHVCNSVSKFHDESIDRKVKYSVSQVLLGTQMPSILVEIGFISNPKEAHLLCSNEYQKSIVDGICNGILSAINSQSFF